MAGMSVAQRMTAEEYLAIPESPENRGWELVAGEIIMHEPHPRHEYPCTDIHFELVLWTRAGLDRGVAIRAIDVGVSDRDVYGPDILWYAPGRAPGNEDPRPFAVPDLAVETRSPSTWRYDVGAKRTGYERAGLPELWLVDNLAEAVLVYRRSAAGAPTFDVTLEIRHGDVLSSPMLPGFALAIDDLFS